MSANLKQWVRRCLGKLGMTVVVFAAGCALPTAPLPPASALAPAAATAAVAPEIDRRYIAVASLGMLPLAKRTVVSVKQFGATGDGHTDDTAALQKAFRRVPTGDILFFPPGTYLHSTILVLRTPNVVIQGRNAVLKAVQATTQSIELAGDKTAIVDMSVAGTGSTRLTTPPTTGIKVTGRYVQVVNNRVYDAASAAIFMYGAQDYRITGNTVYDSLADGIHSTRGSRRGLVEGNTVYGTGDDTIAVVSYTGGQPVSGHILINDNHVSNNPWGRGITCVGCADVTIANNTISGVACCAGVYVANESETVGVYGVLVENNQISKIEMTKPCCGSQTDQAGIDVNGGSTYPIQYVSLENNTVEIARDDGIRVLDYGGASSTFDHINVNGNAIARVGHSPLEFVDDTAAPTATTCWNNTYDRKPYAPPSAQCASHALTSKAWKQFNFVTPAGTTWWPDGAVEPRAWTR